MTFGWIFGWIWRVFFWQNGTILVEFAKYLTINNYWKCAISRRNDRFCLQKWMMTSSMLDLLVKYYMATYEALEFWKPFGEGFEDSIVISVNINQFGKCRIGSKIFGSNMLSRHIKSSYILAKFIIQNNDVDCYLGQIHFFLSYKINLPNGEFEHNLAFIRSFRWYKPTNNRYYFCIENNEICNAEL